jgi:hypothetical protein
MNHTRLSDGEAVHLVNRYCNVFPRIVTTPQSRLVLRLRPMKRAARVTWISPDAEEITLEMQTIDQELRIALPTLNVLSIVRVYHAA